ncbi:MFS transporter [Haloarcula sp. S1CR25-12]|uniref:MFS transporter n=1 Tax=Haloarcula saliterrae TaxID=2950534 RepID=A0ABU2FIH1_9EURY|nr:MFS transporter [Haloarcula sp. S1CR25-12]MDS0261625.1 MFS transporter [Haloarcula sp. S1CR25-12]
MTTTPTGGVPWASRVLRIALVSTLVGVLGVTLVSPLLPSIASAVGVGDEQASLIITVYTLPGIVLSPVAGALADRYGRRPVLVGSLTLYSLCGLAVAAVTTFDAILLLRAGQGVAASGVFSLSVTLLGDTFEGVERAAALGANAAAISIGAAVYPLLGGVLGARSWQTPFLCYAVGLPVALWALRRLDDPPATTRENGLAYLRNSVGTLPRRTAATVFAASFTAYVLLFGGVLTAVPFLLADSFDQPPLAIGVVLSAAALSTAAVALSGGRLATRLAPAQLVAAGYCAYGVGLLTVWLAPGPLVVTLGTLAVGAGQGAVLPAIDGLVSGMARARYRAGVFGLRTSVVSLGATVGPVGFAAAGSRVGYRPALLVGGSVALVAGVVALWRTA